MKVNFGEWQREWPRFARAPAALLPLSTKEARARVHFASARALVRMLALFSLAFGRRCVKAVTIARSAPSPRASHRLNAARSRAALWRATRSPARSPALRVIVGVGFFGYRASERAQC